ncbi:hypothetical protein JMN10_04060 [Capnocytophaga genosp. AHN8471]|jgi:hypothetical protein|uniref:NERD domain-containing protein n=1 Tax=Capnocytophaga genosp. AHN8471 TaxID=327574 RepID=A0ABS1YSC9_9FLAO|nr:hypothetical protein [Capnocytophaga genosp. AHN8471]MBM0649290.1 hypothetical protein [Capnocytophaga genosp. AHN8471]MBM0661364.1 hypothetical protein [Capnocytophaga genosp. AHN8471]
MNTLQQIEEDIKEFLDKELKEKGRVFLNEWDFQMSLSLFLTHIKDYKVHLEYVVPLNFLAEKNKKKYPFANKENINIDIVIEKEGLFYLIELKYKTQRATIKFERFGEINCVSLKDQSRIPMSKYDFWKDVARLEFLKESFEKVKGGLCIFLTNNETYTRGDKGISEEFTMEAQKSHIGTLTLKDGKTKKKCPEFSLSKDYQIEKWSKVANEETKIAFHYCIVRVD